MADKTKPHRAGSMSDDDRALVGKRHTPVPLGVPVDVDSEATPLPQEPPSPELVEGYEELSPPLKKILIDTHNVLREHDIALGRVWPARHVDIRMAELGAAVKGLTDAMSFLQNVPSVLQAQAIHIKEIQRRTAQMNTAAAKLDTALGTLNEELAEMRLEREREKHERVLLATRVTNEIDTMKGRLVSSEEAKSEHSERLKSLEVDRTRVKAWAALIGLLAGIGAWLLARLGYGAGK